MKAIIFVGTQKSGSSREAIQAAERLGYFTVLLTNRMSHIKKRNEFSDVHMMLYCDLDNIDEIKKNILKIQKKGIIICAIISFVDSYCYTAGLLAQEFNIARFSTQAIGRMENKISSFECLKGTNYIPWYKVLYTKDDISKQEINQRLPIILKCPSSTGSKDVYKADTYDDFFTFYKQLNKTYPNQPVLIEEFLDGPQFLAEVVVDNSKVNIIAVIEQEITYKKRFIVTGYNLVTNLCGEIYDNLTTAVKDIVAHHGLISGPCHLEMRYVGNRWMLIEVNPRMSGAGMNRFIQIGLGINLAEETLKLALGQPADLEPNHYINTFAKYITVSKSGVMKRVTGKNRAMKCEGVKEVFIKPKKGAYLYEPTSMGHRYAYVIATGETAKAARKNAEYAASLIEFDMDSNEHQNNI